MSGEQQRKKREPSAYNLRKGKLMAGKSKIPILEGEEPEIEEEAPEAPERVDEILKAYKLRKKLSKEQWEILKGHLATIPNVKALLGKKYGYDDKDYNRLVNTFSRRGWPLGTKEEVGRAALPPKKREPAEPEKIIKKTVMAKEREIATKVGSEHMEDVYHLGNLVKSYGSRVSEMGFYDKSIDKPNLDGFTTTAFDFFIENRDKVEELEMEAAANIGIAKMMVGVSSRLYTRRAMMRMMIESLMRDRPDLRMRLMPLLAASMFKGRKE